MSGTQHGSEELSGADKAAALLMALPPDRAADIFRHLQDVQVERLATKLLGREPYPAEVQEDILREAYELATADQFLTSGGVEYARTVLQQAFGKDRANDLIERLLAKMEELPFQYLQKVEPSQIVLFLHNQHPQIIALILSHLDTDRAAEILSLLPPHLQPLVSVRLANMEAINPSVVTQVERAFRKKLSAVLDSDTSRTKTGGVNYLVKVLRLVDRTTERAIIEHLDESAPELAAEIKRQMFVFENLTLLDDRSMQRVLRDVDQRDLALALRSTTEAVRDHVFHNMSQRAAATVREEIDSSSPVRLRTIEEAQQRIVEAVRTLEDAEEIVVSRGQSDVLL